MTDNLIRESEERIRSMHNADLLWMLELQQRVAKQGRESWRSAEVLVDAQRRLKELRCRLDIILAVNPVEPPESAGFYDPSREFLLEAKTAVKAAEAQYQAAVKQLGAFNKAFSGLGIK